MASARGLVYLAGYFRTVSGQARRGLASVTADGGTATAWNPAPDDAATSVAVSGDIAYVGGPFTQVGGQPRQFAAAVDAGTGQVTPRTPDPNGPVAVMGADRGSVSIGGQFSTFGGVDGAGHRLIDDFSTPQPQSAPSIEGAAIVGRTLGSADGSWLAWPVATTRREWLRCNPAGAACVPTGVVGPSYLLAVADVGGTLRVSVTATNPRGESTALSAPSAVVAPAPAPPAVLPPATLGPAAVPTPVGNTAGGPQSSGTPTPPRKATPPRVVRFAVATLRKPARLTVTFWISVRPTRGLRASTVWISPRGKRMRGVTHWSRNPMRSSVAISAAMRRAGVHGTWTCVVSVGGKEIRRVKVRL